MAYPRSRPDGCASATSLVVEDAAAALVVVDAFLAQLGSVDVEDFARHCSVEHPDGLRCVCQAEVFRLPRGECLLEMTRMRGDAVLFSLVFRLLRAFLQTGTMPEISRGQLLPRHRRGPARGPATVPLLALPLGGGGGVGGFLAVAQPPLAWPLGGAGGAGGGVGGFLAVVVPLLALPLGGAGGATVVPLSLWLAGAGGGATASMR